jgi:hypothetical protein
MKNKAPIAWFITCALLIYHSQGYQGDIWHNHDYWMISLFMVNGASLLTCIYLYLTGKHHE